jgi:transposase
VPGIGQLLSLVLLYAIHDIDRFASVQDCVSSCRLVQCAKESAGQRLGTAGKKSGHGHLKGAFSAAAALFLRNNAAGQSSLARVEKNHGQGKAWTILAHTLARAVYYMRKRQTAFTRETFLHG